MYTVIVLCVGAMDSMAQGLRCAANLLEEGVIPRAVKVGYLVMDSSICKDTLPHPGEIQLLR